MNTYGTKQHWIPAAVLGRFRDSQSKAKKRVRENEIIIRRRGQIGLSVNKAQEGSSFKVIWDFVQRRIMAKDVGLYHLIQN